MLGLFNLKPALPRYAETWNPQIVLEHLKTYPPVTRMSLKQMTMKLTILMALLSAQRTQTLHLLSLDNMSNFQDSHVFKITSILKQTKAGHRHLKPIVFFKIYCR